MPSNKLINESSPYLQQHAHNPVNWYPWGDEAISLAKQFDKPILVSIGYSACHWCHVMERESFEDATVAGFMNDNFINIKIDREERPDLDHIYMEAVQVMTGSGGWPLNVFLTPQLEPFYGGTYFPPKRSFRMPSWIEVLSGVSNAWQNQRDELLKQASNLLTHLKGGSLLDAKEDPESGEADFFTSENAVTIINNILKTADTVEGGFGKAPKFPQTFSIQNLLFAGTFFKRGDALQQAHLSLEKMIAGGIYDQLGGGLARYSTDAEWLVPHFEKMLYDNALFITVLSEAYQQSNEPEYERVIHQTFDFLQREMRDASGGYYSALDADSEGEEGKYYVWSKEEIEKVIPAHATVINKFYGITDHGNWEGRNILTRKYTLKDFAQQQNMDFSDLSNVLVEANAQLLKERNKRVRPGTDDKILLAWNAMLITAYCKAYAALGEHSFRDEALRLFEFCTTSFDDGGGGLLHTYKKGVAKISGNLEDYATVIEACIALQEVTGNPAYLEKATAWLEFSVKHFSSPGGMFYYTRESEPNILFRKVEVFDAAVPSSNALMAHNMLYLGMIWDREEWTRRATLNIRRLTKNITAHPNSFGVWAKLILHNAKEVAQVVVSGEGFNNLLGEVLKIYLPNKVLQSNIGGSKFPLLRGKSNSKTMIHICKNYICLPPMSRVADYETYVKNYMIK